MLVYLSLGANLGNREQTIDKAVQLLSEQIGPLIKRSSFFYSKPWGFDSPNDFCNLCASFRTTLAPIDLLLTTQSIERQLGRTKKSNFKQQSGLTSNSEPIYSDRNIDIDIIRLFDGEKEIFINMPELTIPHKNMEKRDFVMIPLQEITEK